MAKMADIKKLFDAEIKKAKIGEDVEKIRVKYLGRKGLLNDVFGSLNKMPLAKRKVVARQAQALKKEMEEAIRVGHGSWVKGQGLEKPKVDLTAPGRRPERGHLHPLTLVLRDIKNIFMSMGFSVVDGPEVENEYYNFDALNITPDHPARDAWDTFWLRQNTAKRKAQSAKEENASRLALRDKPLLRTHTSPVQIRYMEQHTPPFQIIVPGRVFRYEATDASHEINFHQLEGLMVGKDISLANFKFVIEEFFKRFFRGQKIDFRYRPSYFPFVEPGLEVDIKIANREAQSAKRNNKDDKQFAPSAKRAKWLEVMGAGMVHPHVFEYAHYNPRDWRGFAFGIGIDRLAMIKYGIPDARMFYNGDLRIIKQF